MHQYPRLSIHYGAATRKTTSTYISASTYQRSPTVKNTANVIINRSPHLNFTNRSSSPLFRKFTQHKRNITLKRQYSNSNSNGNTIIANQPPQVAMAYRTRAVPQNSLFDNHTGLQSSLLYSNKNNVIKGIATRTITKASKGSVNPNSRIIGSSSSNPTNWRTSSSSSAAIQEIDGDRDEDISDYEEKAIQYAIDNLDNDDNGGNDNDDDDNIFDFSNSSLSRLLTDELKEEWNSQGDYNIKYNNHNTDPERHPTDGATHIDTTHQSKPAQKSDYYQHKRNMASLLALFDASTPPSVNITNIQSDYVNDNVQSNNINTKELNDFEKDLHALQLWIECESQRESVSKYEAILQSARQRQDYTSLKPVRSYLLKWYKSLRNAIEDEQKDYLTNARGKKDRICYGAYLCTLQPEKMAVISAHIGITYVLSQGGNGSTLARLAIKLGEAVEAEVNVQRLLRKKIRERNSFSNDHMHETINNGSTALTNNSNDSNKADTSFDVTETSNNDTNGLFNDPTSTPEWMYGASHLARFVEEANKANIGKKTRIRIRMANRRALKLLQEKNEPWTDAMKVKLGAALIQILLDHANLDNDDHAFKYEKKWVGFNRSVGFITIDENFYKMIVEDKYDSLAPYSTRHKPMIVPPRPWTAPNDGGYFALQENIMRSHGCELQNKALQQANLDMVYEGLNALGKVPWKINKKILNVAQECWDKGIVIGDIPSRKDFDLPPLPIRPERAPKEVFENKDSKEFREHARQYTNYKEETLRYRRIHQKNMDLRSLRCNALLKLNQAEKFKNFQHIYFPYNLDFRGRAYPVPPHLSNVGSDMCRGILMFSKSKPLGEKGLYWLKVHLANLAGNDKISFDERAKFTEKNMDLIRDSVDDPLGGKRWWMTCDDPFQALAACMEVVNAIDSGDPSNYECFLPVHMDGSCNGLQHYAALGRDTVGGTAVNLCPCDKPQDVYSGVMNVVIARVAEEANKTLDYDWDKENLSKSEKVALKNNKAAKLVNGLIDRGVVKRTVMTSVYGVTFIGAKQQIKEKLEEKLVEKGMDVFEIEEELNAASNYLASMTMDVMGDLFQGARETMNWLSSCARLISAQGTPMAWVSPVGLPIVQPYRKSKPYTIITLVQYMVLSNNNDNLPIHKSRQVTAFPPNYVHSLDSSHMFLTALEMNKRGLTFSSVHDSFWTHPSDIDELNEVLRECFIELYDKPLLEELKKSWELRYPSIKFPSLPQRGDLDLNVVKNAPYFFQ